MLRRQRVRALVWVLVIFLGLVPALAITPAGAQNGGLSGLLSNVPDRPASHTVIWYGAPGDLERLLGVQVNSQADVDALGPAQRLTFLLEFGQQVYYSDYSGIADSVTWNETFGINGYAVTREITVGATFPDQFGIMEGAFDSGTILNKLTALGYQQVNLAGQVVMAFGADGDTASGLPSQVSGGRYNRLLVGSGMVVAAPSSALMEAVLSGGGALINDPTYAALAEVLESPNNQGGALLSAGLWGGDYLVNRVLTPALGQSGASRDQLGISAPLPGYLAAGVGYSRIGNGRQFMVVLIYNSDAEAQAAAATLAGRMSAYMSAFEPGRQIFGGWAFSPSVSSSNGVFAAVVTGVMPDQTDVGWVKLAQDRDILFLLP